MAIDPIKFVGVGNSGWTGDPPDWTRQPAFDQPFHPFNPPIPPIYNHGCICPPTSEQTCQGDHCPRRPHFRSAYP